MPAQSPITTTVPQLKRQLGVFGAIMLGLGSIIGTGVFVSIGIGAGIAGPAVIIAIAIAALVAACNGLSSAQLAASHPVSGGTYEYGYQYASPSLGFIAGWLFLCAKSASAATAALGLAGYLLNAIGQTEFTIPIALTSVLALTLITLLGINRTNKVNIAIVSATFLSLAYFVIAGLPSALQHQHLLPVFAPQGPDWSALFQASALMFVAYTGYGRIATMGEEVHQPRATIPRAIIATLLISMALYIIVGAVAIAAGGADAFYAATTGQAAPLEIIAQTFGLPGATSILAIGAITAMAGVLLNLILGLSRVLLAMGRRNDMPTIVARLDQDSPRVAVVVIGLIIAGLVLIDNVKTTWSFSAFTVLIYYAITNFCALRLPPQQRLYPRWIAIVGLLACLSLACFVEREIWLSGLGLIGIGLCWHYLAQKISAN